MPKIDPITLHRQEVIRDQSNGDSKTGEKTNSYSQLQPVSTRTSWRGVSSERLFNAFNLCEAMMAPSLPRFVRDWKIVRNEN